jgi:hypothetical protein
MSAETAGASTEPVTHAQRRHLFEELVGAEPGKNHRLWWALDQVITSAQDERDEANDREVAKLCRHFPALESVMLLVWEAHVRAGGDTDAACRICEPVPSEASS